MHFLNRVDIFRRRQASQYSAGHDQMKRRHCILLNTTKPCGLNDTSGHKYHNVILSSNFPLRLKKLPSIALRETRGKETSLK